MKIEPRVLYLIYKYRFGRQLDWLWNTTYIILNEGFISAHIHTHINIYMYKVTSILSFSSFAQYVLDLMPPRKKDIRSKLNKKRLERVKGLKE